MPKIKLPPGLGRRFLVVASLGDAGRLVADARRAVKEGADMLEIRADLSGRSRRECPPLAPAGVRCGFPGGPPTPRLKGPSAGSDRGACQPWEIPRSQEPDVARGDTPAGTFVFWGETTPNPEAP
jgi:hypothetical protein